MHIIPLTQLYARMNSGPEGLTSMQADRHTALYGKNFLSPPVAPSLIWLFLRQLWAGFNTVLWFAALMSLLSYKPLGSLYGGVPQIVNVAVCIILLIVIFVSAGFSSYQDAKSIRMVESFSTFQSQETRVRRRVMGESEDQWTSVWFNVDSSFLVVGDIIRLSPGSLVPADLRLISVESLQLNNSMLTGETSASHATVQPTNTTSLMSRNLAFASTRVLQGTGVGMVIATGDSTLLGKLSVLTSTQHDPSTNSLTQELHLFVGLVCRFVVVTAIVTVIGWSAWIRVDHTDYMSPASLIINLLSLIVAYVPQGLPICLALTLQLCAARMLNDHALCKDLLNVDTYSHINVLASDKTGQLSVTQS